MADEQAVRQRASSEGFTNEQTNEAVNLAKNDSNLTVDEIITRVKGS